MPAGMAERLDGVGDRVHAFCALFSPRIRLHRPTDGEQQQPCGEEARGIGKERGVASEQDREPGAERRADGEHRSPCRRHHRRRRGEILFVDDVGHTGLRRRSEEGTEQGDSTLRDEDHPGQPRPGEQEQQRCRRLGERHDDQNPAAVETIRHRACERTHHEGRQALGHPEQ